jgi:hypothetical protein
MQTYPGGIVLFCKQGIMLSAEHIPDLINKFDLVLHSISPLREYDQGHIVGGMVEYRSVYNRRVMPLFSSMNRISCKFAGYHIDCARLQLSNCSVKDKEEQKWQTQRYTLN